MTEANTRLQAVARKRKDFKLSADPSTTYVVFGDAARFRTRQRCINISDAFAFLHFQEIEHVAVSLALHKHTFQVCAVFCQL